MKKILYIVFVGILLYSCENNLNPYNSSINRLGFEYDRDSYGQIDDSIKRFTFVYSHSSIKSDTVWIDLRTVGFLADYDRPFLLKQTAYKDKDGNNVKQAIKGTHYLPFDDEKIKYRYYIPAGKNQVLVPIVLNRDKSLKDDKYYLKIEIQANEYFSQSYIPNSSIVIEISDILTKPKHWNGFAEYYFAGKYGQVKHKFMIDVSGKKIDDEYFYKIVGEPENVDMGYTTYLSSFYSSKLREYNLERKKQGLGELREEPKSEGLEGELVRFTLYGNVVN